MFATAALSRGNLIWLLRVAGAALGRLLGWVAVTFAAIVTVGWVYGCAKFLFYTHWRITLGFLGAMFIWWLLAWVADRIDRRRRVAAIVIAFPNRWDDCE